MKAIFGFFRMMERFGLDKEKFQELKEITQTAFLYKAKSKNTHDEAEKLAARLIYYDKRYIFEATEIYV